MSYLNTGSEGTKLIDIIHELGNKSYKVIGFRCKWEECDGVLRDDFFGAASYNANTRELTSLDGDTYSLNDKYIAWEEYKQGEDLCLTVWEHGVLTDF